METKKTGRRKLDEHLKRKPRRVWLSDSEYIQVCAKADVAKMPIGYFIREASLNVEVKEWISSEDMAEIKKLRTALNKLGANFNQVVVMLRQYGSFPELYSNTQKALSELDGQINQLLKKQAP